jgi:hypothetical protein
MTDVKNSTSICVVETDYGWAVEDGSQRLGLFLTHRQAVTDLRKRVVQNVKAARPKTGPKR